MMVISKLVCSEAFPAQSEDLGKRVHVMFGYDGVRFNGVIVRDDKVAPMLTIIRLDDGRHVLTTECQYSLA
jgi:hypothetical protein